MDKCCVWNCKNTRPHTILHKFPHPERELDRFNKWIYAIGGNVLVIDPKSVFKNGRICNTHFDPKFNTSSKRLSYNAVPSLFLSGIQSPLPQDVTSKKRETISSGQKCEKVLQPAVLSPNQPAPSIFEQPAPSTSEGIHSPLPQDVTSKKRETISLSQKCEKVLQPAVLSPNQPAPSIFEQPAPLPSEGKQNVKETIIRSFDSDTIMSKNNIKKVQGQKDSAMIRLKKPLKLPENVIFKKAAGKFSLAANIFKELQLREGGKNKLGCRFTKDEKIMSLALYNQGPRAYRWLRKRFVLPSPLTLTRMIRRDNPQVRKGKTQLEKRPDAELRDQPLVSERVTQSAKRPVEEFADQPQVSEGVTQNKKPDAELRDEKSPQVQEPAGTASPPQDTDITNDRLRPRQYRGRQSGASPQALPGINTLPSTSEPQPGPSGTGPVKRERPDDTASPSTLEGDAKRVRVNSAQGEQITYAWATKDIPERLAVAICFPPPSRDLTKEEATHIQTDLESLMMDTDSTKPLPAFRGYPRVADGTVQLWCEDDDALTWLIQNVPKIRLPDTDLTLTVMRQSDVPTRVRASLFVPRYKGDVARLHSILIRQNTWYDIASWSLYRATTVGGDNYGMYLTLGVPPEEAERVLARERRISYLLGSIYVRFWSTTQSSDTQTDNTDMTTTQPAQTNDTDIIKLEEVMAPAAMADEDTIPPASPGWDEQALPSSPSDLHDDQYSELAESLSDGSSYD